MTRDVATASRTLLSTPALIGLLVGAAALTTLWTATSLQPASATLLGFRPVALDRRRWASSGEYSAAGADVDVRYERVAVDSTVRAVRSMMSVRVACGFKFKTPRVTPRNGRTALG